MTGGATIISPQQVNLLSSNWWYPVAFLTTLIVWLSITNIAVFDIAVSAHLMNRLLISWNNLDSCQLIIRQLPHLETDLQLGGELPTVGVWTREEARDAEDDVVAVRIVRDAIAIRDNCPITYILRIWKCKTDTVLFPHPWMTMAAPLGPGLWRAWSGWWLSRTHDQTAPGTLTAPPPSPGTWSLVIKIIKMKT